MLAVLPLYVWLPCDENLSTFWNKLHKLYHLSRGILSLWAHPFQENLHSWLLPVWICGQKVHRWLRVQKHSKARVHFYRNLAWNFQQIRLDRMWCTWEIRFDWKNILFLLLRVNQEDKRRILISNKRSDVSVFSIFRLCILIFTVKREH